MHPSLPPSAILHSATQYWGMDQLETNITQCFHHKKIFHITLHQRRPNRKAAECVIFVRLGYLLLITCIRHGKAQDFVIWTLVYGLGISLMDFYYRPGMTQDNQLDHSLSLRLLKPFFDNVLPEHGGLPRVLPLVVHLDTLAPTRRPRCHSVCVSVCLSSIFIILALIFKLHCKKWFGHTNLGMF